MIDLRTLSAAALAAFLAVGCRPPASAWTIGATLPVPETHQLLLPQVVAGGGDIYVVGNILLRTPGDPAPATELFAHSSRRGPLGAPEGKFTFMTPRAGLDSAGGLHVVWGEPRAGAPGMTLTLESLWLASYRDGAWSAPEKILDGGAVHGLGGHQVLWRPTRGLSVLVVAGSQDAGLGYHHLERSDAGWRRRLVSAAAMGGMYGAATVVEADLVAAHTSMSRDGVSIVRAATDWRDVAILPDSLGASGGRAFGLAGNANSGLWLTWTGAKDAAGLSSLVHALSIDGGATWQRKAASTPLDHLVNIPRAATACGMVSLALGGDGGPGLLTEVRATTDGSIVERVVFPEAKVVLDPAIAVSGDSLVMVATIFGPASGKVALATRPVCGRP